MHYMEFLVQFFVIYCNDFFNAHSVCMCFSKKSLFFLKSNVIHFSVFPSLYFISNVVSVEKYCVVVLFFVLTSRFVFLCKSCDWELGEMPICRRTLIPDPGRDGKALAEGMPCVQCHLLVPAVSCCFSYLFLLQASFFKTMLVWRNPDMGKLHARGDWFSRPVCDSLRTSPGVNPPPPPKR